MVFRFVPQPMKSEVLIMSVEPIHESHSQRRARQISEFCSALIATPNVLEAARRVGISTRTARKWMVSEIFTREYVEHMRPTLEAHAKLARALQPAAMKALAEIVANPDAADTARVAAAREIREANLNYNEVPDLVEQLQARIRALEAKLEAKR
jgi:hypothetical protein